MKIHGNQGWEEYPSLFPIFIPHVLEILDDLNLKITFFIVGQDATLPQNRVYLKMIAQKGHEIGNHSFSHESWLQLYSREKIKNEIVSAEKQIIEATGQKPVGFRGPGFSWSPHLLSVLTERGYSYDSSTLPTYIGPLARMYYFYKSDLSREERKERSELFGKFKDGVRPLKPYFWDMGQSNKLLEIPVTTIPVLKIPFHLSYLLYLSRISKHLMMLYLKVALWLCQITKTAPCFLLHPLDLISGDKIPELSFFPGMDITSQKKVDLLTTVLRTLANKFTILNMSSFTATLLKGNNKIKTVKVNVQQ